MATTRPTRAASKKMLNVVAPPTAPIRQKRKKTEVEDGADANASKKQNTGSDGDSSISFTRKPITPDSDTEAEVIPAVLSFSFADARTHLISADVRFKKLFNTLQCKPFEHLEPVEPFRYLVSMLM
jgi:DNA-3-methyladenine glycosylase II